jgi:hypothetical protein
MGERRYSSCSCLILSCREDKNLPVASNNTYNIIVLLRLSFIVFDNSGGVFISHNLLLITLMMEAASISETSVNYQATRRNIPEGSHLQPIKTIGTNPLINYLYIARPVFTHDNTGHYRKTCTQAPGGFRTCQCQCMSGSKRVTKFITTPYRISSI